MAQRTLDSSPRILPLYARAAAQMVPGASLLPFVPGGGKDVPQTELVLPGVEPNPDAVADYAKVCGFTLRNDLPPTYPHVLAFPLHMALMASGDFPFGAVGLVHIENRIAQQRRIGIDERLTLRVRATKLEPHPKGRAFTIVSEAHAGEQLVWEGRSKILRRGKGGGGDGGARAEAGQPPAEEEWRLEGDLGRRYAGVSGDRNPIHMHALSAKALGFPRAIAHGMWTKARCLAALDARLPESFEVEVGFRKPILLPATVAFGSEETDGEVRFAVRDAGKGTSHLDGRARPIADPERK